MGGLRAVLCSRNAAQGARARAAPAGLDDRAARRATTDPTETGETYVRERARKARVRARRTTPGWTLGEDSGSRWTRSAAAPASTRRATRRRARPRSRSCSASSRASSDRRARYVSELVALAPDGRELRGTGVLEGRIADAPRGSEGFGYDPVFVPDGEERTVAELGDAWKARALASRARRAGATRCCRADRPASVTAARRSTS